MTMTTTKLDTFTAAYVKAALWSSTGDDGGPLDDLYTAADVAPDPTRAGVDFWMARDGHGAGFWDGGWPHDVGRRLTDAAHAYGSFDLYVGDDGMVHGQ
jgi:hypothetical protein